MKKCCISGKILIASLLILSGIMLLARNVGWITYEMFDIIVTQISRVELFGKETYQLLLKNGTKLRVSLTGYRLLKERLGL